jgi:hypothetical protein
VQNQGVSVPFLVRLSYHYIVMALDVVHRIGSPITCYFATYVICWNILAVASRHNAPAARIWGLLAVIFEKLILLGCCASAMLCKEIGLFRD